MAAGNAGGHAARVRQTGDTVKTESVGTGPATQPPIRTFGVEKFGQPLFVSIAGKREDDF
jgi:hypothetical protein